METEITELAEKLRTIVKDIEAISEGWIKVEDALPPMFKPVLVFGIIKKQNICRQVWEARRWTGCTQGFEDPPWGWFTPTDCRVNKVTHWMAYPVCKEWQK
jgi:hypothetical protein